MLLTSVAQATTWVARVMRVGRLLRKASIIFIGNFIAS